jgi:beta-lactam-binding protein with PASTA domain
MGPRPVDEPGLTGVTVGDPLNPAAINPGQPDIAGHIQHWLSVAIPPKNVTERANFHYDQRGNLVGTAADGGIMEARHDQNLPFDANVVWNKRNQLDSVDHCKLEEYVLSQLQGQLIDHCRGRYVVSAAVVPADVPPAQVTVPSLTGLSLQQTRRTLERAGLKPQFSPGRPASSKQQEGIIARQDPQAGARLSPGMSVKVEVYGPYNPITVIPELRGQTLQTAKVKLDEQGLKTRVVSAGPAPSGDLSFKVEATSPPEGSRARPGDEVALRIYSKYDPSLNVPDVQGLAFSEAKRILSQAGLKVMPRPAGPAPSEGESGRVKSQEPLAGDRVEPGSEVAVYVFSNYVPAPTTEVSTPTARVGLPNLQCPPVAGGLPLVASESGYQGRADIDDFRCTYQHDRSREDYRSHMGDTELLIRLEWEDEEKNHNWLPGIPYPYCRPDGQGYNAFGIYSKTKRVKASINNVWSQVDGAWSISTARKMLRQIEPYALTCPEVRTDANPTERQRNNLTPKWVLVKTIVNAENKPTESAPPGPRFRGSFTRWGVKETSLSKRERSVNNGYEYYNVTIQADFDKPPRELFPGDTVNLRATATASGTVNQYDSGIQFEYRADGISLQGNTNFQFSFNQSSRGGRPSITTHFVVPETHSGEISIVAFLWNCDPCNVRWVYQAQ